MKCRRVRKLLDGYVDGALAAGLRRKMASHLAECAECRASEQGIRAILERAGRLSREIRPSNDLWSGIRARIGEDSEVQGARRRRLTVALAGAAALAAAVIIAAAVRLAGGRENQGSLAGSNKPGLEAVPALMDFQDTQEVLIGARTQLRAALEERRSSLSPATLQVVDENLLIIDKAIADITAALERDPGNKELPALLVLAYRQEIDLLRQAAKTPPQG